MTAVLLAVAPRRPGPRELLSAGAGLVTIGSALSAAAPSFALLAAAQGVAGIGVGLLVAVGIAAAWEWPRGRGAPGVLAWAIAGMPVAWIVGMPVVGVLADLQLARGLARSRARRTAAVAIVRQRPADRALVARTRALGRLARSVVARFAGANCSPMRPGRAC